MSGIVFKGVAIYAQSSPEIRGYVAGVGPIQLSVCPENIAGAAISICSVGFHTHRTESGIFRFGVWITIAGITANILIHNKPIMPKVRK